MLMVLEALVPCYLQKLKSNTLTMESASAARDEIAAIAALATSLQALLYSSEALTRSDSCQYNQRKLKHCVSAVAGIGSTIEYFLCIRS